MKRRERPVCMALAVVLLGTVGSVYAALTTFAYTGGGANPNVWSDPANWSKSGSASSTYPGRFEEETLAVIPNGFSPSFTTGATKLYSLQTGNGAVSFNGNLEAHNSASRQRRLPIEAGCGADPGEALSKNERQRVRKGLS